jgi:Ca-activated chloride channel family protein
MTLSAPVVVLACAVALVGLGQTPQTPIFRGGVRTVPVYVTATDRSGGFVLDLTKEEFELRDNGKVQTISQFITDAQPLSTVILIDGSSSMLPMFNNVLDAARAFVLRMLPSDRTAIASFADRFQMRQPFSSDRDALLKHLEDEFNIRVGTETRLWGSLNEAVLALTRETQRRVVVVLSDGKHWTADYPFRGGSSSGDVFSLAVSYDVMLYAVAVWTRTEDNRANAPSGELMALARDTGGGFVQMKESDDINLLTTQISTELHQQYVLGFTPEALDGKTHKLDVRVKRPGVTVRTRRSYVAPKGQ